MMRYLTFGDVGNCGLDDDFPVFPGKSNFDSFSLNFDTDRDELFCGILDRGIFWLRTMLPIVVKLVGKSTVFSLLISDSNLPPRFGNLPNIDVSKGLFIVGQDDIFTKLLG